jgi:hypothetical protein
VHFSVVSIVGDVSVRCPSPRKNCPSDDEWIDAIDGQRLEEGDEIHTGPGSTVTIRSSNGSTLTFGPETEGALMVLHTPEQRVRYRIELMMGYIAATVNHVVDLPADFAIRTPDATASVRGTKFVVSHENGGGSCIAVYRGVVLVTPENTSLKPVQLSAGQKVCVSMEAVGPIDDARTTNLSPRQAPGGGWLGVRIQEVSEEIADALGMRKARGALIASIDDDGPAKPGGVQVGDVIVMFDGYDIKVVGDLPRLVADTPIGKDVEVVVFRKGKTETLTVKVGQARGG